MTRKFGCGDVVHGCAFTVRADNELEILRHVTAHAAAEHGLQAVSPALLARVRAAIRDLPRR